MDDNSQAERPFVAFGFPESPVQVGVRLNLRGLTVYARERIPRGALLSDLIPGLHVEERYEQVADSPVASIKSGLVPYLQLGEVPVVRIVVAPNNLQAVLDTRLGDAASLSHR